MLQGNEKGQGMVEYGMISGLLAVVVVSSFVALGPSLNDMFEQSANSASVSDGSVPMKTVSDDGSLSTDDTTLNCDSDDSLSTSDC